MYQAGLLVRLQQRDGQKRQRQGQLLRRRELQQDQRRHLPGGQNTQIRARNRRDGKKGEHSIFL